MRLVIADLPLLPAFGALNSCSVGGDIGSHPPVVMLARLRGPIIEVIHALNYSYPTGLSTTDSQVSQIVVSACR